MAVFRVHKTENYTVMSNNHLRNPNLTLKAKGLMSLMLSLPEDWDYSARGLATLSIGGEDSVKSALRELEEQQYLKRTPIREKGIIRDWQYDIYENPETLENSGVEPQVEKPLVVKPLVANQSQINTNIQNTKEYSNSTNVELGQAPAKHRRLITDIEPVKTPAKKKNLYESCREAIIEFAGDNDRIKNKLLEYLGVRLERKDRPFGAKSFESSLKKLGELSTDLDEQIKIIQQSIDRSYPTFYPLNKSYNKRGVQDPSVFSEFGQVKSEIREDEVVLNVPY